MPKPVAYDLSQIDAHIIAYSDRVQRGTKEDRATPAVSYTHLTLPTTERV